MVMMAYARAYHGTCVYVLYAQVSSQLQLHVPLLSEPRLWASHLPTILSYYFQEHVGSKHL